MSSSVLPSTTREDPRNRRRGRIIEPIIDAQTVLAIDSCTTPAAQHGVQRLGTFGNARGTIPAPSFTVMILSTGKLVSLSTCPLGHVIYE